MLSASHALFEAFSTSLNRYADHTEQVRQLLKVVRGSQEAFEDFKRRRRSHLAKLEALEKKIQKTKIDHPQLGNMNAQRAGLQAELNTMNDEIAVDEARLADDKRRMTKSVLNLHFGGLMELAEHATASAVTLNWYRF